MQIKQHRHIDWNSPATALPRHGQQEAEPMLEQINLGENLPPELEILVKRTAYRPTDPLLLPPARFSDTPAAGWQCAIIGAPTSTGETRERSRAVTMRLMLSSAGWKQRPTAAEFYEAVRARQPTARQQALLSTWATEAEWYELLEAWTEHAYTLRELVEALHRAGLSRCRAAKALNGWAEYPRCDTKTP